MWWARACAIVHKSWCHVRLKLPSPRKRLHLKFPNFGGREATTGNTPAVRRLARQRTGSRLVEHWWHLSIKVVSYWVFVTRILVFRGYCFWPAPWCKSIFFDLFWNVRLILRLNKVLGCLHDPIFFCRWIWWFPGAPVMFCYAGPSLYFLQGVKYSGLALCLVAFTRATLVVLCRGENASRKSV